jgi:prepilin-type N-terminal cleavage/methylation domain-containing protein
MLFVEKQKPKYFYENIGGFTIIELVVVIAIISVLMTIITVSINEYAKKSRDSKRRGDATQIQKALEMYYVTNGKYPYGNWYCSNNSGWTTLQTALAPYIKALPTDPAQSASGTSNGGAYTYCYFAANYCCGSESGCSTSCTGCGAQQWYMLVYTLEIAAGPDPGVMSCNGTTGWRYGGVGANTYIKTVGFNRLSR